MATVPPHILVVEDDRETRALIARYLRANGCNVMVAADGHEMDRHIANSRVDLIVLDLMLPGEDGLSLCRRLRASSQLPVIMLTARGEDVDRIVGLEMGADDYLTKPFSMRELVARVKALLRRVKLVREEFAAEQETEEPLAKTPDATLVFGNLAIDQNRREVRLDDTVLRLKPKEFELLLFLARHEGMALSRDLILERVWGWSYDGNSRTVDVHVRWLREKIEAAPGSASRIVTVRGIGYRFDG